jgi:hypothetical protein
MNQLGSLAIRCIDASRIAWFLPATFDFHAKVRGPIGIGYLQGFNGVHGFGLHPRQTP